MLRTTTFVAACCQWPQTLESQGRVAQAASEIEDWGDVRQVVKRHRVIPLVHVAVKDMDGVPAEFREWAKQGAQSAARHAMQLTRDCLAIDDAFKDAGLNPLHFKGPVLAQIVFGSVALKLSHDLDIFVPAAEVRSAVEILESAGYRALKQDGPISEHQLAAIICNFKDLGFIGSTGTVVELHWKFGYNKDLLTGLENKLNRQSIVVANNVDLQTFNSMQMVYYLSVHGAVHHWKRLKWLADLAAFLEHLPCEERDEVIAQVSKGPTGVALAQALKLSDTLFGTHYNPKMPPGAQALYQHALMRIDQPYIAPRRFGGDLRFIKDVFVTRHLYDTPWMAIRALKSHLFCLDDTLAIPLPRHLNGIYPIIRLPSLVIRRLRGMFA